MEKKISFSLPSKSEPTKISENPFNLEEEAEDSNNELETNQEFVSKFDTSTTLSQKQLLVIPPKENTWMKSITKKLNNLDSNITFELEAPTTESHTDPNVSYGLNLRNKENGSGGGGGDGSGLKLHADDDDASNKSSVNLGEKLMLQKFREDMMNLPEDRGFEEFADVPVEGFGAALLRGYGWSDGKGIGKNAKEDVKIVQYVRRGDREGLGFKPDPSVGKKNKESWKLGSQA